jgi:hypothetical protein
MPERNLPAGPAGSPYTRLHGHSFRVEATVRGEVQPPVGWVADLGELDRALKAVALELDHGLLNEKPGLDLTPDALDVYAPAGAGPWPVLVMFHGFFGLAGTPATDRADLGENARRVAELGFVVFNASWGHQPGAAETS